MRQNFFGNMYVLPPIILIDLKQMCDEHISTEKKNEQTSFNKAKSSGLCSLSYPGGGNAKQRDIARLPTENKIIMAKKIIFSDRFPYIVVFQSGNGPAIIFLSMQHDPTLISSFNVPPCNFPFHPDNVSMVC